MQTPKCPINQSEGNDMPKPQESNNKCPHEHKKIAGDGENPIQTSE